MPDDLAVLESALGYEFRAPEPLLHALTHKSWAYEVDPACAATADNERLEFLGDAVLGLVVSDMLLRRFETYREGQLTKLRSQLVSEAHLYEVALRLGLGSYLRLGRGEEMSGGRAKKAMLADAMEAVLGAVYLDGGIEAVRPLIETHVVGPLAELEASVPGLNDFKSALQQFTQQRHMPVPRYAIIEAKGPDHAKTFVVEVRVGAEWASRAEGPTKKSASQLAAQQLIGYLTAE